MPYEVIRPHVAKTKRGRGRPRAEIDANSPANDKDVPPGLYNFPGPSKIEMLQQLYDGPLEDGCGWFNCQRCFLGQRIRNEHPNDGDTVFFTGNPNADILIVGEAPGEQEEDEKQAFIGPAGQILNLILGQLSDDPIIVDLVHRHLTASRRLMDDRHGDVHAQIREWRDNEFAITNVVACRPPENRAPTLPEMKACRERLLNIIYIVDPMLIVACGNTALVGVTGKMSAQITKVRGQIFDTEFEGKVGKLTYPVMPVLHPSYLSRVADWNVDGGFYKRTLEDWKKALRMVDSLRNSYYGTPIPRRGFMR